MKKCVDGEYVEMTAEEMAALSSSEEDRAPTVEERLRSLETAYTALCEKLHTIFSF